MKKVYQAFCKIELSVAAVCLIGTVIVITTSAVLRTCDHPINWGLDIALLLFTWAVFLGADNGLRANKMVNVDLLLNRMPKKLQKVIGVAIYLIIICFLALLVVLGFMLTYSSRFRSFQGISGLSYSWVTVSVPICSAFMIVTAFIKIWNILHGVTEKKTEVTDSYSGAENLTEGY